MRLSNPKHYRVNYLLVAVLKLIGCGRFRTTKFHNICKGSYKKVHILRLGAMNLQVSNGSSSKMNYGRAFRKDICFCFDKIKSYRMLLISGYDKVPRRSWLNEASGLTMVCLNQETICPQTQGDVYLLRVLSENLELQLSPKIYWRVTLISSEVCVLY